MPTDFWLYESVYAFGVGPGSLHYVSGSRQDWVGRAWVVGAAARHYRRPIPTWSGEKADAALPLVLGAVGTLAVLEKVELDLVMSLPYGESNALEQQLVGTHELVCAGGRKLKVVIDSVRVEPEGLGIYRYGAAQVQGGLTGVLDLGAGRPLPCWWTNTASKSSRRGWCCGGVGSMDWLLISPRILVCRLRWWGRPGSS